MPTSALESLRNPLAAEHTEDARRALEQSPFPALRRLSVQESDHTVILDGEVPSYYLKQVAQETVMPLLDGRQLLNRVRVMRPADLLAGAPPQ
jgi:hypothetical protein